MLVPVLSAGLIAKCSRACSSQLDAAGVDDFIIYCIIYRRIWPSSFSHDPRVFAAPPPRQTLTPWMNVVWREINASSLGDSTTCATSPAGGEDGNIPRLLFFLFLPRCAAYFSDPVARMCVTSPADEASGDVIRLPLRDLLPPPPPPSGSLFFRLSQRRQVVSSVVTARPDLSKQPSY